MGYLKELMYYTRQFPDSLDSSRFRLLTSYIVPCVSSTNSSSKIFLQLIVQRSVALGYYVALHDLYSVHQGSAKLVHTCPVEMFLLHTLTAVSSVSDDCLEKYGLRLCLPHRV